MIGLLNPAIDSKNLGDAIIADAVVSELERTGSEVMHFTTRRPWTDEEIQAGHDMTVFVVGGTNLLTSRPRQYRQWIFGEAEALAMRKKVVLLGVGWWQYQPRPSRSARRTLRQLLNESALHSVRDSYTLEQLKSIDRQVINTSCPTMWQLDATGSTRGSGFRGTVVTSITDYNKDRRRDTQLLSQLIRHASKVVVWAQGSGDRHYVEDLGFAYLPFIEDINNFRRELGGGNVSYCGTRLHAGIAAMQASVPTLIVAIDNRAAEIAKDVQLPVIRRDELDLLGDRLEAKAEGALHLPVGAIERWRSEFLRLVEATT